MAWVERTEVYKGRSAIALTARERTAFQLMITLECLYWPLPSYFSYQWNPPRGHYGRLTGMVEPGAVGLFSDTTDTPLFVAEARNLYYSKEVVYNESLDLARVQTLLVSGFQAVLEELGSADIPPVVYDDESYLEFLYWFLVRALSGDPSSIGDTAGVKPHTPTTYALATHPDSVWRWRIASYLSDKVAATNDPSDDDEEPGGGDPSPPNDPFTLPPSGDNPPLDLPEFSDPPDGYDTSWFDPQPDPVPENPVPGTDDASLEPWTFHWTLIRILGTYSETARVSSGFTGAFVSFYKVYPPTGTSVQFWVETSTEVRQVGNAAKNSTKDYDGRADKVVYNDASEEPFPPDYLADTQ